MSSRPDVYVEDGITTFRASAIGACLRALVAARLGIPPQPPRALLSKAMNESSVAEALTIKALSKKGILVQGEQDEVSLEYPEGRITGHLDGYVSGDQGKAVLEVKAFGPTLWPKYVRGGLRGLGAPFTRMYGWQIAAYMYATGLPALLVVWSKQDGQLIEKWLDEPPCKETELRDRMATVELLAREETWPECDASCGPQSWYWHVHEGRSIERLTDAELEQKLAELHELKQKKQEVSDAHDKLRDEVRDLLGHGSYTIGPYRATVSRTIRELTDLDAIRREHGDEFMARYAYQQEVIRLTVKKKESA